MSEVPSNEAQWRTLLAGDDRQLPAYRRRMRVLPSSPRCKTCLMPFGGIGGFVMRALGGGPWKKNPRFCRRCYTNFNGLGVGGAEVELSLLFADVRGSTALAEQMNARDFRDLINRFYATATKVLVEHDAVVDKFVGDEGGGALRPRHGRGTSTPAWRSRRPNISSVQPDTGRPGVPGSPSASASTRGRRSSDLSAPPALRSNPPPSVMPSTRRLAWLPRRARARSSSASSLRRRQPSTRASWRSATWTQGPLRAGGRPGPEGGLV